MMSDGKMKKKTDQSDMLHGPLAMKILLFVLPLAASSILQQLFNSADVAVVGQFAGATALAAVGANSPVVTVFVGLLTGLAVGVNVVIAQVVGSGDGEKAGRAVHTSVTFSLIAGMIIMVAGFFTAKPILVAIGSPEEVLDQAVLYLRIYMAGLPFLSVYNFGAAILRSVGDTKRPMICLVISGILNLILNLILVIVFHLGVAGVAIATDVAAFVSAAMVLRMLCREEGIIHLDLRKLCMDGLVMKKIFMLGGPAAIQSTVFCVSNVCLQSGINSFGTAAIAGSAAAVNFEYFDFYMVTGFDSAAVTFIGQNYAAGEKKRCRTVFRDCMAESLVAIVLMELLFFGFRTFWLGLYTSDADVLQYATIRMVQVLTLHFLICSYEITGSVLRGMGRSLLPAMITMFGSVIFRLIWMVTFFKIWPTFEGLMKVYPVSWILTGTMMIIAYILVGRPAFADEKRQ